MNILKNLNKQKTLYHLAGRVFTMLKKTKQNKVALYFIFSQYCLKCVIIVLIYEKEETFHLLQIGRRTVYVPR